MHPLFTPILADGALRFAFEKATIEGKITIGTLVIVSIFSWTTIFTKARQLAIARSMAKKFFAAYRQSRDPLEIANRKEDYSGAPGYEVYATGVDELAYQLKNNPVDVRAVVKSHSSPLPSAAQEMDTDIFSRGVPTKISSSSYASVKGALEREVSTQALALEKGMIVLSTAVAGGPFIGLLGTVWGVMETFSGIAKAQAASLTAMAPGVAGALIATVTGLFVAIPSMFAYNYMVTTIRAITQELDGFASELATQMEHRYVDNRPLAEEIRDAIAPLLREAASRGAGETDPLLHE